MKRLALILPVALMLACMTPDSRASGTIISPANDAQGAWTENEKSVDSVMRNLHQSEAASFHVLRVRTELSMRKHAASDLVLVVVAGKVELHLGSRAIPSAPGDVIEVPRGVPYGVLNKGTDAAVLYAMFTPALNPDDTKLVREAASEAGDWQWNLWAQ